ERMRGDCSGEESESIVSVIRLRGVWENAGRPVALKASLVFGKREKEGAPFAFRRLHLNPALMELDNAFDNRQSYPRAFNLFIAMQPVKDAENSGVKFRSNPDSIVPDKEHHLLSVLPASDSNDGKLPGFAIFNGILQ